MQFRFALDVGVVDPVEDQQAPRQLMIMSSCEVLRHQPSLKGFIVIQPRHRATCLYPANAARLGCSSQPVLVAELGFKHGT